MMVRRHERQEVSGSVLLATYNRREMLPRVLEPILADPSADEVVVVVDGCHDGSLEMLQEMAQRDSRLRPHYVENGGAARALLAGARMARGEVLVILDDDEILAPGAVSGHLRHHDGHDDLVVVGYVEMAFPPARKPQDYSRYLYAKQYDKDCATWEADPSKILLNLWGGFISMGRSNYIKAMETANEFVDGYHYDLDFGVRCLEMGLQARFDRTLRALHLYERSPDAYLRDARSSGRNRILIHRTHPTVLAPVDPGFVDRGLPPVGRVALAIVMRLPFLFAWVRSGTSVAGHLHLWHLQNGGAGLMRAVEQKRGAIEACQEIARGQDQQSPSGPGVA
jgi:glycosyltransferase involved in cell wall biosynthesis